MALKSSNKVDTNVYEIEVTVTPEVFTDACKSAYMKQRKSIQLPGFRKGKAPRKMIEQMYGKSVFYEDAASALIPDAYDKALEECEEQIVSSDIVGMRYGSLFDATQTMVAQIADDLYEVQVVSWYDNENSYTSQMVRTIKYFAELA